MHLYWTMCDGWQIIEHYYTECMQINKKKKYAVCAILRVKHGKDTRERERGVLMCCVYVSLPLTLTLSTLCIPISTTIITTTTSSSRHLTFGYVLHDLCIIGARNAHHFAFFLLQINGWCLPVVSCAEILCNTNKIFCKTKILNGSKTTTILWIIHV